MRYEAAASYVGFDGNDLTDGPIESRNARVKFLCMVAILSIFTGVAEQSTAAADNVKISMSSIEGSFLFGAVAAQKGFFAQENLNAELIRVAGNVMVPAMTNGDIDYTLMFESVIRAALSNFPLKVTASFVDSPTGALVGKPTITTRKASKGKASPLVRSAPAPTSRRF